MNKINRSPYLPLYPPRPIQLSLSLGAIFFPLSLGPRPSTFHATLPRTSRYNDFISTLYFPARCCSAPFLMRAGVAHIRVHMFPSLFSAAAATALSFVLIFSLLTPPPRCSSLPPPSAHRAPRRHRRHGRAFILPFLNLRLSPPPPPPPLRFSRAVIRVHLLFGALHSFFV
jgi:hypothetical protein